MRKYYLSVATNHLYFKEDNKNYFILFTLGKHVDLLEGAEIKLTLSKIIANWTLWSSPLPPHYIPHIKAALIQLAEETDN